MAGDGYERTLDLFKMMVGQYQTVAQTVARLGAPDVEYSLKKIAGYVEGLFSRAPWQPGDRARLVKTPDINAKDSWGWMGSRHILVEGREGTITSIDFRDGRFTCLWCPDNQTYISSLDGKEYPVDSPGHYGFSEKWLVKVGSTDAGMKEHADG